MINDDPQAGTVKIAVLDNGPGLSETAEKSLNDPNAPAVGIGMVNVHRRLKGFWGESAGLQYTRENDRTCLRTEIPREGGSV